MAIADQIALLEKRGLKIENKERAIKYLTTVGYYRLTGYMYHLQSEDGSHNFKADVSFSDIIDTYQFDKKLRYLLAEYIERIEVAMRTLLTNSHAIAYGFFWYTDSGFYKPFVPLDREVKEQLEAERKKIPRKHIDMHAYITNCILDSFTTATEAFITTFKTNYTSERFPPCNMAMEILSLGKLAKLYEALKSSNEKQCIARTFNLSDVILESWLIFITNVRNICAHHARLWNRRLTADRFIIPSKKSNRFNGDLPDNFNRTVYGTLSVMIRLLEGINPENGLLNKFKILIDEYPKINLTYMGFPQGWEQNPAWARPQEVDEAAPAETKEK